MRKERRDRRERQAEKQGWMEGVNTVMWFILGLLWAGNAVLYYRMENWEALKVSLFLVFFGGLYCVATDFHSTIVKRYQKLTDDIMDDWNESMVFIGKTMESLREVRKERDELKKWKDERLEVEARAEMESRKTAVAIKPKKKS